MMRGLVIGIDATNLRQGGGRTHLIELLGAADPAAQGVERVIVWGGRETLALPADLPWLEKINPPELDGSLLRRSLWQRFSLSAAARAAGCDLLFVPGGTFVGDFHPIVTMSQNMLPFEWRELRRYGWSWTTLRCLLLRQTQSRSFRGADGVIFLTNYAKEGVLGVVGGIKGATTVIPHGLSKRFAMAPRPQEPISSYARANPYRILYVSIVDQYKHQWHLVEAVARLRRATGWSLALDLIGPAYHPAKKKLEASFRRFDPEGSWAQYIGSVSYSEMHHIYATATLGVFASSCENLPIILLENMAAGLPLACSNRGPMPETLRDNGVYFDPEYPEDIARSLHRLIESPERRATLAQASYTAACAYTWERCAEQTFAFFVETHRRHAGTGGSTH